jgi:hypothetical protein
MRELPILDADGKLSATALDIVIAIMTYPEDEERQEELRGAYLVERIPDVPEADQLLAKLTAEVPWLAAALRRSGTPRGVIASVKKTTASAWAVGETLLTMLAAAIHHPEIPMSRARAMTVLAKFHRDWPAERTREGVWSRFRSVAHFYAVRRLWDLEFEDPEGRIWERWLTEHLEQFLATAESIRTAAVMRRFLPYQGVWRVPAALALPSVQIEPGALIPELLELFLDYLPPHSAKHDLE